MERKIFRIHVWLAHFSVFSPICLKGGEINMGVIYYRFHNDP